MTEYILYHENYNEWSRFLTEAERHGPSNVDRSSQRLFFERFCRELAPFSLLLRLFRCEAGSPFQIRFVLSSDSSNQFEMAITWNEQLILSARLSAPSAANGQVEVDVKTSDTSWLFLKTAPDDLRLICASPRRLFLQSVVSIRRDFQLVEDVCRNDRLLARDCLNSAVLFENDLRFVNSAFLSASLGCGFQFINDFPSGVLISKCFGSPTQLVYFFAHRELIYLQHELNETVLSKPDEFQRSLLSGHDQIGLRCHLKLATTKEESLLLAKSSLIDRTTTDCRLVRFVCSPAGQRSSRTHFLRCHFPSDNGGLGVGLEMVFEPELIVCEPVVRQLAQLVGDKTLLNRSNQCFLRSLLSSNGGHSVFNGGSFEMFASVNGHRQHYFFTTNTNDLSDWNCCAVIKTLNIHHPLQVVGIVRLLRWQAFLNELLSSVRRCQVSAVAKEKGLRNDGASSATTFDVCLFDDENGCVVEIGMFLPNLGKISLELVVRLPSALGSQDSFVKGSTLDVKTFRAGLAVVDVDARLVGISPTLDPSVHERVYKLEPLCKKIAGAVMHLPSLLRRLVNELQSIDTGRSFLQTPPIGS